MTRYLTAAEVSTMLGIHPDHWRDRVSKRRGVPAPYRIGGALRWREDEIADWLESTRVSPASRLGKKSARAKQHQLEVSE